MSDEQVLAAFFGDEEFPIEWEDGQRELFWVHDDLRIEPGVADVCRHRRLVAQLRLHVPALRDAVRLRLDPQGHQRLRVHGGHPGSTWVVGRGQCMAAAIPPCPAQLRGSAGWAATWLDAALLRRAASWTGGRGRLRPEMERNFVRFDEYDDDQASLVELAILLEDAIDMHDRHWQIHWVLNFAQFSSTLALNAAIAAAKGEGDHAALMGRLQSSTENRNWDSIEELWKIKEWIKAEQGEVAKAFQRPTAADILRALEATDAERSWPTRSCPTRRCSASSRCGRASSRS